MSNILNKKQPGGKNNLQAVNSCHTVVEVTRVPDEIAKKHFSSSSKGRDDGIPFIRVESDGSVRIVSKAPDGIHFQEIYLHKSSTRATH